MTCHRRPGEQIGSLGRSSTALWFGTPCMAAPPFAFGAGKSARLHDAIAPCLAGCTGGIAILWISGGVSPPRAPCGRCGEAGGHPTAPNRVPRSRAWRK